MKPVSHVTVEALKRIPLWSGLEDTVLRGIAPAMQVLSAPKGFTVVAQDEPTRGVFFLAEGLLAFRRVGDHGGEPLVFALAHQGQMFGERSVVDNSRYSSTITAMRDSILFYLPREEAERVFLTVPSVARRVMQHLSRLVGEMNTARNSLTQRRAAPRLMDTLVHIAAPVEGQKKVLCIDALPTQESLAQLSGLKRETVSRLLTLWQARGFVERKGRRLFLKVPNEAELELPLVDVKKRNA